MSPATIPSHPTGFTNDWLLAIRKRYAHDGERGQYLYALLERRPELLTNLQAYLEAGKRSVYGWYEQTQADAVDCRDMAAQFRNLNRADAFEAR